MRHGQGRTSKLLIVQLEYSNFCVLCVAFNAITNAFVAFFLFFFFYEVPKFSTVLYSIFTCCMALHGMCVNYQRSMLALFLAFAIQVECLSENIRSVNTFIGTAAFR